jgi:hypothetical protein
MCRPCTASIAASSYSQAWRRTLTSCSIRSLRSSGFCRDRDVAGIASGHRSTYGYNHSATACSSHGGSFSTDSKEYQQLVHLKDPLRADQTISEVLRSGRSAVIHLGRKLFLTNKHLTIQNNSTKEFVTHK